MAVSTQRRSGQPTRLALTAVVAAGLIEPARTGGLFTSRYVNMFLPVIASALIAEPEVTVIRSRPVKMF